MLLLLLLAAVTPRPRGPPAFASDATLNSSSSNGINRPSLSVNAAHPPSSLVPMTTKGRERGTGKKGLDVGSPHFLQVRPLCQKHRDRYLLLAPTKASILVSRLQGLRDWLRSRAQRVEGVVVAVVSVAVAACVTQTPGTAGSSPRKHYVFEKKSDLSKTIEFLKNNPPSALFRGPSIDPPLCSQLEIQQIRHAVQHVFSSNNDQALFGLGGDALAPTAPSESMTANFVGLLEDSLGRGVWADPVASQLARPLNAILAYLPPEGARVRVVAYSSSLLHSGSVPCATYFGFIYNLSTDFSAQLA